jgi:hypothetical protein
MNQHKYFKIYKNMKYTVNVKSMKIEFDIDKKEIYCNGELSNVYWVTNHIFDENHPNGIYKTLLMCKDYDGRNNDGEDWIPYDEGREYCFFHEEKNPSFQFLGFWLQRCVRNVNNYYDRISSIIK